MTEETAALLRDVLALDADQRAVERRRGTIGGVTEEDRAERITEG